jgi:uncharacterized membrane protein
MKKTTKLAIAFAISIIGSLLIPIFTQWYEQQTGMIPIGFYFVYVMGSLFSIFAIATNNFKDM